MRFRIFKLVILLLAVMLFPMLLKAEAETLRVGYDPAGSYLEFGKNATFQGYNMEYLYEISKYTNWSYELVPYTKWADAVQALETGEIDILPTVLRSPEREHSILFSMRPMSDMRVALIVPQDDKVHFYGDLDCMQGARIGVRSNTLDAAEFKTWAQKYGLQYKLEIFDTQKELIDALDTGSIEAAALSYVGRARDYRAIAEFAPQNMYFAVTPGRQDILNALDIAMEQIVVMNPGFVEKISKKYMKTIGTTGPLFSHAEHEYIRSAPPVRVTLSDKSFPFSYRSDTGEIKGIIPDLLQRLTELSGLQFEIVAINSQQEGIHMVQEGQAVILGRLTDDLIFSKQLGLRTTTPYAHFAMVQVARKQTTEYRRIALQGIVQKEMVKSQEPEDSGREYLVCPNTAACFEALTEGRVDAIYVDSVTAAYFMNSHRASEYQMASLPAFSYDLVFGVDEKASPQLASILDKSIRFISVDELSGIVAKNRMPDRQGLWEIAARIPLQYLTAVLALLLLAALVLAYTSYSLWRKRGIEKRMAAIKEKNRIIQVDLETAQKVNAVKEEFFSHISHDMRTPLNGIAGFTRLAGEAGTLAEARNYIEKIRISNALLTELVEDTLQLSKLDRGNFQLSWEKSDSMEFAKELAVPIRLQAEEKGLRFTLDVHGLEQKHILMDRRNTRKVFLNVLSNAIKFTPAGGKIILSMESSLSSAGRFVLWARIIDTGIGISREFLPRIFEPFSQEGFAGMTEQPGNGLGLAIAHRLVERMGGEIEVESKPEKGTEVSIVLYFDLVDEAGRPVETARPPNADASRLKGKRALLCEDNALNTEIAKLLLEQYGIEVLCAANGQAGLEMFKQSLPGSIDFILMDLRMPVMDGYLAARGIRSLDRPDAGTVPIIALSADAFAEDVEHSREAGMNAHIAKPLEPEKLLAELLRWC